MCPVLKICHIPSVVFFEFEIGSMEGVRQIAGTTNALKMLGRETMKQNHVGDILEQRIGCGSRINERVRCYGKVDALR